MSEKSSPGSVVREIRRKTRRRYSAEEKIRIVAEWFLRKVRQVGEGVSFLNIPSEPLPERGTGPQLHPCVGVASCDPPERNGGWLGTRRPYLDRLRYLDWRTRRRAQTKLPV